MTTPEKNEDKPATLAQMIRAMHWQDLVALVTTLVTLGTAYNVFVSKAAAAADAGVAPVKEEIQQLKVRMERMENDSKNLHEDMHNLALDLRDLYHSSRYGDRSERLEKPPVMSDAGPTP